MLKQYTHILIVALSTIGSRVLGLFREILLFTSLGTSSLTDAFIIAFTLPNLSRRLLGEGALTSAVIPVLSDVEEKQDRISFWGLLSKVIFLLGFFLGLLTLLYCAVTLYLIHSPYLSLRWNLGGGLSILLMPYMILICVAAMQAAGLNVLNRFAIPALSQVWLNLSMISSLLLGELYAPDALTKVEWLCYAVLFGGVLQVLISTWALRREGWSMRCTYEISDDVKRVASLFLPAVAAAAIFQINVMVSRLLAFEVNESAVSILYLANRLIELPLGVFAIAISTVYFPELSRMVSRDDSKAFSSQWMKACRLTLLITIPAALGLILLNESILTVLFNYGSFDARDVTNTANVLLIYCLALPFYAVSGLVVKAFHARKDMKTPVRLATVNFVVNLSLSLILMWPYGMYGLAAANAISGMVYCVMLLRILFSEIDTVGQPDGWVRFFAFILFSLFGMGLFVWGLSSWVDSREWSLHLSAILKVLFIIPSAAFIYGVLLYSTGLSESRELMKPLLKRIKG